MKPTLRKKIPKYILRFLELLVAFILGCLMTITAESVIPFVIGMVVISVVLSIGFIFTLREILYWASYNESDGWEDDLTNQL
jgi:hypothetical protein